MLLKKVELDAIRAGRISCVFRRWRRPTVKSGGTLKTAVGLLAIDRVEVVSASKLTARDAVTAGWASRSDLVAALEEREGTTYRITLHYAGPDPRLSLRDDDALSPPEIESILKRLERLDAASRVGPWTGKVLLAIAEHPRLRAADLAARTGHEKDWLKTNVRKLKNLGLTISHHPGYEVSPRGRLVLQKHRSR